MGKVKKLRQKYHLSLEKGKSLNNLPQTLTNNDEGISKKELFKSNENIFAGINISIDELTQSLPKDFDVRSIVSTKSRKEFKEEERHLKKKERQKLRHERFINKLEFTYQALKKTKTTKKKQKKSCSNMTSLLEALPSLESKSTNLSKRALEKRKVKTRGTMKAKHRLKQQSMDSKIFKKILDNKKFKANPFATISEYLKQKLSNET